MKNRGLLIGLGLLIVLAVIGFIAVNSAKQTTKTNSGTADHAATQAKTTPTTGKDDTDAAAETTSVSIKDYMFEPMAIKVKAGDTVTWTNKDSVQHNVVADTPSADAPNGPLLSKGETYGFTFKKTGVYNIHCGPHPYMKATITVSE